MSTRASVIVTDGKNKLYFYQHSDGYPEGLGVTLDNFIKSEKAIQQVGDIEYFCGLMLMEINLSYPDLVPAIGIHGDESYTYVIDCDNLTIETIDGSTEIAVPINNKKNLVDVVKALRDLVRVQYLGCEQSDIEDKWRALKSAELLLLRLEK